MFPASQTSLLPPPCYDSLSEELIRNIPQAIYRDIARTYPEHHMFKKKDGAGQESLFNVMKAYSVHDREVSYCHIVIECYEENIGRKTLITLKKG